MTPRTGINPIAWLLWFIAVSSIPLTSRHPLYLTLALLIVIVVHLSTPAADRESSPWRLFAYVGSSVAVLSVGFNLLTVHSGDRPFAELPSGWPIIGGPLTYNALLYGVASTLAISAVLFAAATFNTVVRHTELIRRVPRSFQQFGVAGAIALNYVPQTIQAGRDIYDAQRARGRQMRNIGDARAFLVPLLGNGLERAVQMSEALETRGYGHQDSDSSESHLHRWRIGAAIALIVVALPMLATGRLRAALLLAALAVVVGFARRGALARKPRRLDWSMPSIAIAAASLTTIIVVLAAIATSDALSYSPFPRLIWPEFNPLIAAALCLQLAPAFFLTSASR